MRAALLRWTRPRACYMVWMCVCVCVRVNECVRVCLHERACVGGGEGGGGAAVARVLEIPFFLPPSFPPSLPYPAWIICATHVRVVRSSFNDAAAVPGRATVERKTFRR